MTSEIYLTDDEIIDTANEVHRAMPIGSDEQDEVLEIVKECIKANQKKLGVIVDGELLQAFRAKAELQLQVHQLGLRLDNSNRLVKGYQKELEKLRGTLLL